MDRSVPVQSATSILTIEKLRIAFATHGLPEKIVTDNGSVFTSAEFTEFTEKNGLRHIRTSPYHPASNRLAERAIQSFKHGVSRLKEGSWEIRLSRFLFKCRITLHSTTGRSPAELLLGRQPRSRLDLLQLDTNAKVLDRKTRQKYGHDQHSRVRGFQVGDKVYLWTFTGTPTWLTGKVLDQIGPVSFRVQLPDGQIRKRHVDHLRVRYLKEPCVPLALPRPISVRTSGTQPNAEPPNLEVGSDPSPLQPQPLNVHRSSRIRNPPNRLY